MSITKLMADPKARDIYISLDKHIHPATLADDYLQAKLAGNKSLCLALHCFIQDLARMHFNRPEVLRALDDIERYAQMRKPGKGAPKMLQDIADQIEQLYAEGLFDTLGDGRIQFRVFTGGKPGQKSPRPHLKVTCKNMPGAVALVAAKYRRGLSSKPGPARYGTNWQYAR
jgi:hypothetical protein